MKRIRALWNRSDSPKTNYYHVYRSTKMDIEDNKLQDLLIARMEQVRSINPVSVVDEPVTRISNSEYQLEHRGILLSLNGINYDFSLKRHDGAHVTFDFTVDLIEGRVTFDDDTITEMDLVASYTYDGICMWDYDVQEKGKTYYGPEAKDASKPDKPENVQLIPEYDLNRIKVVWDESAPTGVTFYYRVQAFENEQTYSRLSDYRSVKIVEELADRPYLIEKSIDGVTWKETARVKQREYIDFLLDNNPPMSVRNLTAAMSKRTEDTYINVSLTWGSPSIATAKNSPMYRVRAVNQIGYVSDPSSPVGPIPFDTPIKEIVIRVKESDGTIPSFSGSDSGTAGVVGKDETSFDYILVGNKTYTIAVYVVDMGNNISIPITIEVTTPDNSKPIVPTILSVSEFSTIVN